MRNIGDKILTKDFQSIELFGHAVERTTQLGNFFDVVIGQGATKITFGKVIGFIDNFSQRLADLTVDVDDDHGYDDQQDDQQYQKLPVKLVQQTVDGE